jgi:hypothetical protein
MIDIYLKKKDLRCEEKIKECYDYYSNIYTKYDDIYNIYEEYDRIKKKNPPLDTADKNIFFKKKGVLKKVNTKFMKECLLESLKRLVEDITIKDSDSKYNIDIQKYKDESSESKDNYHIYPDIYENDISAKLLEKEELRIHSIPNQLKDIKDKCDNKFFELAPHQLFLKNLISPNTNYYGLLIFHGVGVGKTCSGISIAENFRDIYGNEENKIIILASQNIRIGWKNTIFDPSKGENQCTGDDYYFDDSEENKEIDKKYAKNKIKKYYELSGYSAFANKVKKMLSEKCRHLTDENEILEYQIKLIKEKYSDRVLIIDEVHNVRSDEKGKEGRDTIHYLEMVIKYSDNLRLILLTANPMYNLSTEIVWILNMLLLNDKRTTINEKEIFDKNGNMINESLLKEKSKGYISYLRGENPISFPIRLYPSHDKKNIIKKPQNDETDNRPQLDIFGKTIDEDSKLSFLELYGSKLIGHQEKIYMDQVEIYKEKDSLQIDNENLLLQLSNMVYPGESDNYNDLYGENGLANTMKNDKNSYSYQSDILEEYGEFFHKDLLGNYSAKIKNIIEIIEKSDGIVFIYSNWIKSGILPLVLALEQNGYTNRDKKEILKNSKKIPKISYEGKYIEEYDNKKDFYKANYMVISGTELKSNNLEEELKIVSSEENKEGQKIKVIIGSTVASEGLDFKNIRSIHILEPWHNINKIEQVIGRGIRNCSHKNLDSKDRNVTIYLHNSVLKDTESIDMYLYRYSEHKARQIGNIENILKKNAIDKYFFQNGNFFDKRDINKIMVNPCYRSSRKFLHDRSDKKYSRVCSFSEICNFMENDNPKKYFIPEKNKKDTFQIKYNESLLEIYKKRIHNLYSVSVCYTFGEIKSNLSDIVEVYPDFLYHSLKGMISEKYTLHNCNGDKGYLVRADRYYLFQPYFNNDILLPNYYRLNKGNKNQISYEIIKKEKLKNVFLYEKHKFTNSQIDESFKKLINFELKTHESKVFDYLPDQKDLRISYAFDRLLIEDKYILGYAILLYIKENEIVNDIDESVIKHMISFFEKLFIYYDGTKYYYQDKMNKGSEKDIVGFFLYHHSEKKPLFFNYMNREIEIYNKVDEIDVVRMIKKYQKNSFLDMKGSWGFTTYSERIKYGDPRYTHNGIVLKVIKSTDKLKKKYVYPSGPGIIIQDQATGAWIGESTYEFIIDEFSDILNTLDPKHKKSLEDKTAKRDYVCFIELCLRIKNKYIQNDLIFMKYY